MKDEGTVVERLKERTLFAATAVALGAYVAAWVLAAGEAPADGRDQGASGQLYRRRTAPAVLPAGSDEVFASADPAAYWDETLARAWVEPKREKPKIVVRLDPPRPTVPAPPMLLPVPGPALEFTSDLPRWPEGPRPQE